MLVIGPLYLVIEKATLLLCIISMPKLCKSVVTSRRIVTSDKVGRFYWVTVYNLEIKLFARILRYRLLYGK